MSDKLMRTFISIPVPNEVKSKKNMLYSTLENSPSNISWVKNEQLHRTLKYLSYTPETSFDNIIIDKKSNENIDEFIFSYNLKKGNEFNRITFMNFISSFFKSYAG